MKRYLVIGIAAFAAFAFGACGPSSQDSLATTSPGGGSNAANQSSQNDAAQVRESKPSLDRARPDLHGLERVDWPNNREDLNVLFNRLPQDIAGLQRSQAIPGSGDYGPDRSVGRPPIIISDQEVRLMSTALKQGAATADQVIEGWSTTDVLIGDGFFKLVPNAWLGIVTDVKINQSGRDRKYVWIRFTATSIINLSHVGLKRNAFYRQEIHGLAWGKESGNLIYLVLADSPNLLGLGVQTFVAAAKNDEVSFPPLNDVAALDRNDPSVWPGFSLYVPDLSIAPEAQGVAGLGKVPEITDKEQVGAIIGAMPRQLLGQDRFIPLFGAINPTIYNATYGQRHGPQLTARNMGDRQLIKGAELPEGWTPAHVVVDLVTGPGISDLAWGRDGSLVWATFMVSDGANETYHATWATESSGWLFGVSAPTDQERQALLEGFVAAAQSQT